MSIAGEIACFGGWVLTLPFFRASELSRSKATWVLQPRLPDSGVSESFLMLEEGYAMERRVQSHGRNSEMLPFGATSSHAHLTRLDGQIFSGIDLLWIDPN